MLTSVRGSSEIGSAPARYTNFDTFRLLAAVSVLFSHSFVIVEGNEANEPLVRLLGPGNILGGYGVSVFFIISGFLITRSFVTSNAASYCAKRVLRIFPGLIACVLVTTTIAVAITSAGRPSLEMMKRAAHYVIGTIILKDTSGQSLVGLIYSTNNDYGAIFNGSLWSLGPEFACYFAVLVFGWFGVLNRYTMALILVVGGIVLQLHLLGNFGQVMVFFAAGSLLYFMQDIVRTPRVLFAAAGGLIVGVILEFPALSFGLFGSVLLIAAALGSAQLPPATRFGDLSYGIYLYGWPVEQTLRAVLGDDARWWNVFLLSVPICMAAAVMSWWLVEKPALRIAKAIMIHPRPAARSES